MVTFAFDTSFFPTYFHLVSMMAQKVWRLSVLVSVHDRYSHFGNCIGLPPNSGLFWSNEDNQNGSIAVAVPVSGQADMEDMWMTRGANKTNVTRQRSNT